MSPFSAPLLFRLRSFLLATLWTIALAFPSDCGATFHTYRIEQLYSNADGSVQFIVLHESANSNFENLFSGHFLRADTSTG